MEELEFTTENLKMLCEKYPNVFLTQEDSYRVGNCEEGTAEWAKEHFPRRKRVKVSELIPYMGRSRVANTLWHKLLPLYEAEQMKQQAPE